MSSAPLTLFTPFVYPPESTKVTLAPANADVKVGEDAWMQCGASHDPALDITFIWSLDGRDLDLHKDSQHYERTTVRRHVHQQVIDDLRINKRVKNRTLPFTEVQVHSMLKLLLSTENCQHRSVPTRH